MMCRRRTVDCSEPPRIIIVVTNQRGATWGGGVYQGGASHVFNNGTSASRSTSLIDNGDGTVSYSASRTGLDGATRSVSGTAQRR